MREERVMEESEQEDTLFAILRGRHGFTLLEIMIALAIIGVLLVTVIHTLNYHLGLVEKQESVTVATLLAKTTMAEMKKLRVEKKGFFEKPYGGYAYETYLKDSPYPGIAEIMVVVKSGKEAVTLNEFVFK